MAISIVGAGSLVQSASSTAVAFGSGWTTDDLHLVYTAVKSTANSVPATPSGYTDIVTQTLSGQTIGKLCGRLLQPGDVAPNINGGGTSLLIGGLTLRGTRADSVANAVETSTVGTNSSASAINYSAATISTAGCMVALWGYYNTSGAGTLGTPTTLSGSAANTVSPYTGTNLKGTLWTDLQTSAASISAGNIPISGGSTQTNRSLMVVIRPAVSSTVTISDAGDEDYYSGETGITITGTAFGASQGAGFVKISPTDDIGDADAVTQTVTSWANTSIQFTAARGSLDALTTLYLFVQNDSSQSNAAGFPVQLHKRGRISLTLNDRGDGDNAPVAWASKTGILYRLTEDDILGDEIQSGNDATTDGSGVITLPYFDVTSGGTHTEGNYVALVLMKDDATLGNVRLGIDKLLVSYT